MHFNCDQLANRTKGTQQSSNESNLLLRLLNGPGEQWFRRAARSFRKLQKSRPEIISSACVSNFVNQQRWDVLCCVCDIFQAPAEVQKWESLVSPPVTEVLQKEKGKNGVNDVFGITDCLWLLLNRLQSPWQPSFVDERWAGKGRRLTWERNQTRLTRVNKQAEPKIESVAIGVSCGAVQCVLHHCDQLASNSHLRGGYYKL